MENIITNDIDVQMLETEISMLQSSIKSNTDLIRGYELHIEKMTCMTRTQSYFDHSNAIIKLKRENIELNIELQKLLTIYRYI